MARRLGKTRSARRCRVTSSAERAVKVAPPSRTASYNDVVKASELSSVMLVRLEYAVDPEFFKSRQDCDLSFNVEVLGTEFDPESGQASAIFQWTVEAKLEEKSLLACSAGYVAAYNNMQPDLDPDAVRGFIQRFGRFATYPYFRAMVAHVTWASGVDLPVMPILRER